MKTITESYVGILIVSNESLTSKYDHYLNMYPTNTRFQIPSDLC